MVPTLKKFQKGELWNLYQGPKEGPEVEVLGQGTGMSTGTGTTEGEAAVEAGAGMNVIVIVEGTGIVAEAGAGAAVEVPFIVESVEETNMVRGVVEANPTQVLPL